MSDLAREVADEILLIGAMSNHELERLPASTVRRWAGTCYGQAGLALCLGVANWGVRPALGKSLAADSAGRDWLGVPRGSGKHWRDRMEGGLGLCHADSGMLVRVYDHFGSLTGVEGGAWKSRGVPKVFAEVRHDPAWQAWAEEVLSSPDWGEWLLTDWAQEYYRPAYECYVEPVDHSDEVALSGAIGTAACWARVANSEKGTALRVLGASRAKILSAYLDARPASADRRHRQLAYALRVGVAVQHLMIGDV